MLRVLHVIYDDPANPWVAGGGSVRVREIYRPILQRLQSVTVLTGAFPGSRDEEIDDLKYVRLGSPAGYIISRSSFSLQASWRLATASYDAAVFDFSTYAPLRLPSDRPVGVTVHHITGSSATQRWGPIAGRIVEVQEAHRLRRGLCFSATSAETERQLREIVGPKKPIHRVGAGVPSHLFALPREEAGYLLYFGRLDWHQKGLDTLLDAAAVVLRDFGNLRLKIAGRGKDVERVARRVEELGLTGRVDLLGPVSDAVRDQLFVGATMLLMPSRFEGFGMVAAEAMAAGVPVIASDAGSLPEVVGEQNGGLLVPAGDSVALAQASSALAGDPLRRQELSRQARLAAGRFRWANIAEQHLDFLNSIVSVTTRKYRNLHGS